MKYLVIAALFSLPLAFVNCGGGGACEGRYGAEAGKVECFNNWDESDCSEWDEKKVNGSNWTYHLWTTCEDLGFTRSCGNNTWVKGSCP